MPKDPFAIYDKLPPAIRKAVRETSDPTVDYDAAFWLRNGATEDEVIERLRKRFNPICADLPESEETDK